MDLSHAAHVVVVGGGVAGLACARALEAASPACDVALLEASTRLGGKVSSERVDGFVLDAGSDVCIGDKLRRTSAFAALGLDRCLVPVNPNDLPTLTWRDGALHTMPVAFTGELVTFRDGMQGVVDALATSLRNTRVVLGARATAIERTDNAWRVTDDAGHVHRADAVVIALPGAAAANLLQPFAREAATTLGALRYLPTTTVSLAWPRTDVPHDLYGTGYLVADAGDSEVTACTWTSSKIPSHAPHGFALLRGYVRGRVDDPVALVLEHLRATLGVTAPPALTRVTEWGEGLPEYSADHAERVAALERELARTPGLFVAGAAFHGVGVPDCMLSGETAAAGAVSLLATLTS